MFDAEALAARGCVTGTAGAGRGGATFFTLGGAPLVLRHYRRGGAVRHLSADRYVSRGAERSRPMREFALLVELERLGLPAPTAYAARRVRHGPFESGSLVMHRLPGDTLAERLATRRDVDWAAIGRCVARFHRAGVAHADLNAHNVMVAPDAPRERERVSLIDFDRGRIRPDAPSPSASRNLARLVRSVRKVAGWSGTAVDERGLVALETAWRSDLADR